MRKNWKIPLPITWILEIAETHSRIGGSRAAAALSYFLVLTLFPLLMCINFLIGLLPISPPQLLDGLDPFLPQDSIQIMLDYLAYVSSIPKAQTTPLLLASLFTILLSASAGMRTLLQTMDDLYEVPLSHSLHRIFFSVSLSLLFLLTVYLSIIVIFTGEWFFLVLEQFIPPSIPLPSFSSIWQWLRYLLLFSFVFLLVLMVYRAGTPTSIRRQHRGILRATACLSALAMVACSALFSWFIDMSTRYSLVYGSLASLMILLAWLYFCGNIFVFGAIIGRVWSKYDE